jgi:hypothetical protein
MTESLIGAERTGGTRIGADIQKNHSWIIFRSTRMPDGAFLDARDLGYDRRVNMGRAREFRSGLERILVNSAAYRSSPGDATYAPQPGAGGTSHPVGYLRQAP